MREKEVKTYFHWFVHTTLVTLHPHFVIILLKGYLGQNRAYIDGTGVQAPFKEQEEGF